MLNRLRAWNTIKYFKAEVTGPPQSINIVVYFYHGLLTCTKQL